MQSATGKLTGQTFDAQNWTPHTICPACRSAAVEVTRTLPIQRGDTARIRYHRCRICRALFKSVEALK